MSYCEVGNGIRIFYRRYGHGSTKILFIIGLAGTHESWGPQIKGLTGTSEPNDREVGAGVADKVDDVDEGEGIEACCFDNRGMGRSSVPAKKSEYTTTIMARDALALLNHLGWKKAHVFGHSMGAMIACKLAAMAPERLCSLALLNATGGGFECFPKLHFTRIDPTGLLVLVPISDYERIPAIMHILRHSYPVISTPGSIYFEFRQLDYQMISLAFRFLRAKTPEQRALVDLETHYTKEYLDEYVGSCTRRKILYQQYVTAISTTGMQSNYGLEGQVNACWTHKMTAKELDIIRSSGFLVSVIHGRYDIIAQLCHARKLAQKLQPSARMVELHGGHLVSHERPDEVNQSLTELIKASKSNFGPEDWSNLPRNESGRNNEGANCLVIFYSLLAKLQFSFLYIAGLFMMAYEHMRSIIKRMRPTRVAVSDT